MMKKPVSALNNRRPITQYAKMAAAMGGNPRYKVCIDSESNYLNVGLCGTLNESHSHFQGWESSFLCTNT